MSTIVLTKPQGGGSGTTLQLYVENPSSPGTNTVTGINAVAIGSSNVASGTNSLALGTFAKASLFGQIAHASGKFATSGDAQGSDYIFRGQTVNATPEEIFLDGTSSRLVIADDSCVVFSALILARRTDSVGDYAGFRLEGIIKRDTGSSSIAIIGSVNASIISRTNSQLTANITADTVNGSLKIMVTGIISTSYNWVVKLTTVEEIG